MTGDDMDITISLMMMALNREDSLSRLEKMQICYDLAYGFKDLRQRIADHLYDLGMKFNDTKREWFLPR